MYLSIDESLEESVLRLPPLLAVVLDCELSVGFWVFLALLGELIWLVLPKIWKNISAVINLEFSRFKRHQYFGRWY